MNQAHAPSPLAGVTGQRILTPRGIEHASLRFHAGLIDDAGGLDPAWLEGVSSVGVTAGASAPEVLVQGLIDRLAEDFDVTVEEVDTVRETVSFKLPRALVS